MSLYKKLFVALLLVAISGLAQAADLENSTQAVQTDTFSIDGQLFAKATKAQKSADPVSDTVSLFEGDGPFLSVYTGYDYASLGDVVNGTKGWKDYGTQALGATATLSTNNSGVLAGAMFGLHLDKSNAIALDLGTVLPLGGNNVSLTSGGATDDITDSTSLFYATADYILDIAQSASSKTYLTAGVGWYHATSTWKLTSNSPVTTVGDTYSGDTIGGILGIGEEISLGGALSLDLSAKGRLASFSKLSNSSANNFDGNGSGSIALLTTNSGGNNYTVLVPLTDGFISSNSSVAKNASFDFTGFDVDASLKLYL